MEDNTIFGITQQTLAILEKEVVLAKSTLDVVASRSFKPISEFFKEKQEVYYSVDLLNELDQRYQENLKTGAISRNVYNLRTRGRRIQSVRELLKYLSAIGIDCYVIPSSFLPKPDTRTPYIFTDKELHSIFKECDDLLPNKCSPNRHLILPVLLRLVFFCGLRPNEGRELQSCDIDFDKGILLVRKNKSHKEFMSPCPMMCCRCARIIILPMPIFSLVTHTFSHLRTACHTIGAGFPDSFE